MTRVAILPEPAVGFRAIAGARQSVGKTAGEALDAMNALLSAEDAGTLVIVQNQRPDQFFNAAQQQRLGELMQRWRHARDSKRPFPPDDQTELDSLIDLEIRAATNRAAHAFNELPS